MSGRGMGCDLWFWRIWIHGIRAGLNPTRTDNLHRLPFNRLRESAESCWCSAFVDPSLEGVFVAFGVDVSEDERGVVVGGDVGMIRRLKSLTGCFTVSTTDIFMPPIS